MDDWPWSELGIAPTEDRTAIRQAYARRLKTIDLQTEPNAFIALRAAYKCALNGVLPTPLPSTSLSTSAPVLEVAVPSAPAAEDPWLADMAAIRALHGSHDSREAIFAPLAMHTARLVAHSRSCSLEQSATIEHWISETIVNGIPRSNGMLEPAIAGFQWAERVEDYDCPEAVRIALERAEDARYLQWLLQLNPLNRQAWNALTEGVSDFDEVHAETMTTLLGVIQHQRPGLLEDVDIARFERCGEYLRERRVAERRSRLLALQPEEARDHLSQDWIELAIIFLAFVIGATIDGFALVRFVEQKFDIGALALVGFFGSVFIAIAWDRWRVRNRQLGVRAHRR